MFKVNEMAKDHPIYWIKNTHVIFKFEIETPNTS